MKLSDELMARVNNGLSSTEVEPIFGVNSGSFVVVKRFWDV